MDFRTEHLGLDRQPPCGRDDHEFERHMAESFILPEEEGTQTMTLTQDDKYLLDTALFELSRSMPALRQSALAMIERLDEEPAVECPCGSCERQRHERDCRLTTEDPELVVGHQYATEAEYLKHLNAITEPACPCDYPRCHDREGSHALDLCRCDGNVPMQPAVSK